MKLYELTEAYNHILELLEEGEDETLRNTLESIEAEIEDKAENMAKLIKNIDADVNALKEEEKRLSDKRKTLENKKENIKQYLESELRKAGKNKIKLTTFTVAIQKNPPSVNVLDETKIPEKYWILQPKLDRKSLLSFIKDGNSLDGVELVQSESLRIR